MTTALDNIDQVFTAFRLQCDAYLIKPISKSKVLNQLRKLRLIEK
jgi:two-component system chemotaxis response regulator CheY